jgi:hypothetical protein
MWRKLVILLCAAAAAACADQFVVGGKTLSYKGPFSAC